MKPHIKGSSAISSIFQLSRTLSLSMKELALISSLSEEERYTIKHLPKSDGTFRVVYSLHPKMRLIQARINKRIFKELLIFPDFLYGSVPSKNDPKSKEIKRDYVSCAEKHCGAKTVLKIDISNFFDNIHRDLVSDVLKNILNIRDYALNYLVDILCKGDFIVQGALTSSYIASLCLYKYEGGIYNRAIKKGLVYTRLVDDITVSSKLSNYDFTQIKNHIENMLAELDLPVNNGKTKIIHSSSSPLLIHGIRVDFDSPRLGSDEVKRIKASLHNLKCLAVKNNTKTSVAYRKEFNRCMGRVNKLGRVNHEKYIPFKEQLLKIKPMPSVRDLKVVDAAISSLEASYKQSNHSKHWYKRKYNLTLYKMIILTRSDSFSSELFNFRQRISKIKPI